MFELVDIYQAYRKAKYEAFYEKSHFNAVAFSQYEKTLQSNLASLLNSLNEDAWYLNSGFIGNHAYVPKGVNTAEWELPGQGHFRSLSPIADWNRRYKESKKLAEANLRLIIKPTVNFQIISALWIIKVGHLFDSVLSPELSFGNRLRRTALAERDSRSKVAGLNMHSPALFAPYFSAYRRWREGGLSAMQKSVESRKSVLAITMDLERFYHRVGVRFLLRSSFLSAIGLKLDLRETRFTNNFLTALETWYRGTPDYNDRPEGALPVGLTASRVIANVLLYDFDNAIKTRLAPIYYGRYVDDIFLVVENEWGAEDAKSVTRGLIRRLSPLLTLKKGGATENSIKLNLPYASDSDLVFSGAKQKIFALSSEHGSDLIDHIRDQIRQQSSEYRLLASVPRTGLEMASRALLATPDAALQSDALRKADVISVRRLGFSLLLADIETYAQDLAPSGWIGTRKEFYGIVYRQIITPNGFFDFFAFIPRIFGLMLACGDFESARRLISALCDVIKVLRDTTSFKKSSSAVGFDLCLQQYAAGLVESALAAATTKRAKLGDEYLQCLRAIKRVHKSAQTPTTLNKLTRLAKDLLIADFGRRPYKEYWILDQTANEKGPQITRDLGVLRALRLGAIRRFREQATKLRAPYWPALAFPTRALKLDEIVYIAPSVLRDPALLKNAISLLRGAGVASAASIGLSLQGADGTVEFSVPSRRRGPVRIAVTSVGTTNEQWAAAAQGKRDYSLERYDSFNSLINNILRDPARPQYIVMPELSVPLRWALRAARKLAANGVSFLAGAEYHVDFMSKKLRNDAFISLATNWPGYSSSIMRLQPKFQPAHREMSELIEMLGADSFYRPSNELAKPTIYAHGDFNFSVLICSDLTNINHRQELRGKIDAIFAIEWNQDINSFGALVESTAADLHAYVIQVNNRIYGDSRVRVPAREEFRRDLVQVKGGLSDYYVIGELNIAALRHAQQFPLDDSVFKPLPIGFIQSGDRTIETE